MSEDEKMGLNYYPPGTQISAHTNNPVSSGEDSVKKLPIFWCDTCSLKLATPTQAIQHFSGKSHLAAVTPKSSDPAIRNNKRDLDSNSNLMADGPDPKKVKLNQCDQSIECKECGITLNSSSMAEQHFKGKKHALILKKLEAAAEKLSNSVNATFCQFCSITLNSVGQVKQHYNGMRHKMNIGLVQPPNLNQRTRKGGNLCSRGGSATRGRGNLDNHRGGRGIGAKSNGNFGIKMRGKLSGNGSYQKRGNGRGIVIQNKQYDKCEDRGRGKVDELHNFDDISKNDGKVNLSGNGKARTDNRGRNNNMGGQKSKHLDWGKSKHNFRVGFCGNAQANKPYENPYLNDYSEINFQSDDHVSIQERNGSLKNFFDLHSEQEENSNSNLIDYCYNPSEQTVPTNNIFSSNMYNGKETGNFIHNHTHNSKNYYSGSYDYNSDNNYDSIAAGKGDDSGNYYSCGYQSGINGYYGINKKKKLEPKSDFQIGSDAMYDAYYA